MAGPKRAASSASTYAASHLSLSVLALLSSAGFSRSSEAAAHLLTEVLQRYVQLLGTTCVQHANHSGRNVVTPQDLSAALAHIMGGEDMVSEVFQWAEDEGRLDFEAGQVDSQAHAQIASGTGEAKRANGTVASASSDSLRNPYRGKDLLKKLSVGRPRYDAEPAAELHYTAVSPEDFEALSLESAQRETQIEELVWSPLIEQTESTRPNVKAGKKKAVDPHDMVVDSGHGVNGRSRRHSRSGSTTDNDGVTSGSDESGFSSSDTASSSGRSFLDRGRRRRSLEADGTTAPSLASHQSRHRPSDKLVAENGSRSHETARRRFGELEIDYVPAFLPAFPHARTDRRVATASDLGVGAAPSDPGTDDEQPPGARALRPPDTDLEHLEEEERRVEAAQRAAAATKLAAAAMAKEGDGTDDSREPQSQAKPEPTAEEKAVETEQALEAMQARRVLRDCWRESIAYDNSTLGATYAKAELDDLDKRVAETASRDDLISIAPPSSSLRAFAADFKALVEDPSTSGSAGVYLTPSGTANQDSASKRRRIAFSVADPSRYIPNDSLYGAVAARPVMLPFQPGPSWLVSTLPPPTLYEDDAAVAAALSAPILTPVLPQGRPSALIPPSGSLVPPLAYRHPAQLSLAARMVSNAELSRRVSRFDDPPPLLDDKHAERFFHGLPASRDLVGGSSSSSDLSSNISKSRKGGGGSGSGNTTLRAALEKLVLQLKEKEAVVLPEEDKEELQRRQQELQLQLQAAESAADAGGDGRGKGEGGAVGDSYASRIRNGNITMVHTWDWTVKDPFDTNLPGRRVRATGGGGDGEGGQIGLGAAPLAIERDHAKRKRDNGANGPGPQDWSFEQAVNGA